MVRDDTVVLLLGLLAVSLVSLKFLQANRRHRGDAQDLKSVTIIVLGDIGRSPRMLYHATSFMQRGYKIYIVAYPGTNPRSSRAQTWCDPSSSSTAGKLTAPDQLVKQARHHQNYSWSHLM